MDLSKLMQQLYYNEAEARTVLVRINYPLEAIPAFDTAEVFWPRVLQVLDYKVKDGSLRLAKIAAEDNPGSQAAVELHRSLLTTSVAVAPGPPSFHPGSSVDDDFRVIDEADGGPPGPPAPPSAAVPVWVDTDECPTLTLEGADLADQFLAVVGELLGMDHVALLYVARDQSALRIIDPGDQDEVVRQKVQEQMHLLEPSCRVTYRKFSFRPYLYTKLVVYGPDTSGYELETVPATSTTEEIAAAIIRETREAHMSVKEGLVRIVVDLESAEMNTRLDPYTTLHECGVVDGDVLRVGSAAIAGGVHPELRVTALVRAAGQLRAYAVRHDEFTISDYDDEELPGRITVEITRKGLAPPVDVDRFIANDDPGSLDDLIPVPVKSHRVSLHFRAMFPLVAPLVVWETPVFHPNIRRTSHEGFPVGTLQFHPLLMDYRAELDLAHIARLMTDVATYRDYDLADGPTSPDPVAAAWAGTDTGQTMIKAIGGRPQADVVRQGDHRTRQAPLLWIRPLGEARHGH